MLNVATRLNYFAENEAAEAATRNFDLILEKASEQYKTIWNKYLDLVKKYETFTTEHETVPKIQKEESIHRSTQISPTDFIKDGKEEEKLNKPNKNVKEYILKTYHLGFNSDTETTILENDPSPKGSAFLKQGHVSESDTLISNDMRSNIHIANNVKNINEQATSNDMDISFDMVYNSPTGNDIQDKIDQITAANTFKRDNYKEKSLSPRKEPLKAIENVTLTLDALPKGISGKKVKHKGKQTPTKILRQTKLLFRTPKMNMDDSVSMIPSSQGTHLTQFGSCTELLKKKTDISKLSEKQSTKGFTIPHVDSGCVQDNTSCEDIIEKSPDRRLESRTKNRLKLKRRLLRTNKTDVSAKKSPKKMEEFDSVFMSTSTPLRLGLKKTINCSSSTTSVTPGMSPFFISETMNEDEEENQSCLQGIKMSDTKEFTTNNKKSICVKQTFSKTNMAQSTYGDETYFPMEENFIKMNSMSHLPKESIAEQENVGTRITSYNTDLSLSSPLKKKISPVEVNASTSNVKKPESKPGKLNKEEAWSCWECAEYYRTKRGVSEDQIQMWKNKCSRHRNPYYAMKETPPGFWDPVIPDSCSSMME